MSLSAGKRVCDCVLGQLANVIWTIRILSFAGLATFAACGQSSAPPANIEASSLFWLRANTIEIDSKSEILAETQSMRSVMNKGSTQDAILKAESQLWQRVGNIQSRIADDLGSLDARGVYDEFVQLRDKLVETHRALATHYSVEPKGDPWRARQEELYLEVIDLVTRGNAEHSRLEERTESE